MNARAQALEMRKQRDEWRLEARRLRAAGWSAAVLALQGNDYHRGQREFAEAIDDLIALTKPSRAEPEQ